MGIAQLNLDQLTEVEETIKAAGAVDAENEMVKELKKSLEVAKEMMSEAAKNPDKEKIDTLKEWFSKTVDPTAFNKVDIKLTSNSRSVIAKKNFKANEAVLTVNFDKGAIDLRRVT